jgi:hypothetical protein
VVSSSARHGQQRAWLLQAAGLFTVSWLPRLIAVGAFITWDELMWVYRSVHFGQALLAGDWAATFRTGHPGVTTTWLGALGIGLQRLLLHTPSPREWSWLMHLPALDPLDTVALQRLAPLLVAAKIPLTLVTALAVVACWALARQLVGPRAALWGGVLMACDPFFLGLSRVLHLDALLASFMAVGLLSLLAYIRHPARLRWLMLSAFATGLACLTKAPAFFLLPLGALLLWVSTEKRIHAFLLWSSVVICVYVALWPAMWVAPLDTLGGVLDKAFGYAAQAEETSHFFRGAAVDDPGGLFYPLAFLFRTSPLVLLGLLASPLALHHRERGEALVWVVVLAYSLLFGLAMALGAKKFDRYLLPLFLPMDLLAGMGWAGATRWISERAAVAGHRTADDQPPRSMMKLAPSGLGQRRTLLIGAATLALAQALLVLPYHPHYLAWYDPLLGGLRQAVRALPVGWGEGLEEAAAYLNARPNAETLTIASAGVPGMAPRFRGRTLPLKPASLVEADYVVVYVSDRQGGPSAVDEFIATTPPAHTVRLHGVDYAWVYANETDRAPLEHLASEAQTGDALMIAAPSLVGRRYDGPLASYVLRGDESEERVVTLLSRLAAGHRRVWYLHFPALPSPAAEAARYQLSSRSYLVRESMFPLATLSLYQLPGDVSFAVAELRPGAGPYSFGGQLRLDRYALADPSIGWGQELGVQLVWRAVAPPEADYTAFLHLVDPGGHLWGQVDVPLRNEDGEASARWAVGAEETIRYLLPPWAGIPPGQYELVVGVYGSDTEQHLPATGAHDQPVDRSVTLGGVQIAPSPLQPTVKELAIHTPLQREVGNAVLLLGYHLWPSASQPGTSLHLDLFWQVVAPSSVDYELCIELAGETSKVAIANDVHRSSRWRPGERLRGQFEIPIPASLPQGEYPVRISLAPPGGGRVPDEPIPLGSVRVEGRTRHFQPPVLPHRVDLRLGDRVILLGYDVADPTVRPGEPLHLTLYWQAEGPTDVPYAVFTHLLDTENRVVAQKDSAPQNGAAPTTSWLPGEVITDEYWIPVPSDLSPVPLQVEVGMYDPATGQRLPMYDSQGIRLAGDRALLTPLRGD